MAMRQPNRKRKMSMESKEHVDQDGWLVRRHSLHRFSLLAIMPEMHSGVVSPLEPNPRVPVTPSYLIMVEFCTCYSRA